MYLLKSLNSPIPENYYFKQDEPPFQTIATPLIEVAARSLSDFRIANRLGRASLSESLQDVIQFTCKRFNNSPTYCFDCQTDFETHHANHPYVKKACSTCGSPIVQ